MKPTDKQINRVDYMAYVLGIPMPDEFSKVAYSQFITKNKKEYINKLTENDWEYDLDEW